MINDSKKNKKVLVIEEVEDEASLREALRDKFTLEGFSVLEAGNGEEGLKIALRERPDLIILDIIMPKMDGIEMMRRLRQESEWGKKVPIIILTNIGEDNDKINQAITENKPAYYFVKSQWKIEDLVEKIKERLGE